MKRYLLTLLLAVWCSVCLGANIVWQGDDSADWNTGSNWVGNTKPSGSDVAVFDGAESSLNCLLDSDESLLGISVEADYEGTIDLGNTTKTLTIGSSGVVVAGHTNSTWDMGDCTLAVTGGPWTVVNHAGTWTEDASTVTFDGTCTINAGTTNDFFHVTVDSGTTSVVTNSMQPQGTVTLNSILSVDTVSVFSGGLSTLVVNDGGALSGSGLFQLNSPGSGEGVTTFHAAGGTIDIARFYVVNLNAAAVLAPGNYQSAVKVYTDNAAAYTLTLSNGDYTFTSLELECTDGGGSITLDTTACVDDTITTGDLTIDDQAGAVTITDTATAVDWDVSGDMATTGAGTFLWNQGTGTKTFSGTADQTIDSNDVDLGTWDVAKSTSGYLSLNDATLELGTVSLVGDGSMALEIIDSTVTSTADAKTITGASANSAEVNCNNAANDIGLGAATWTLENVNWITVNAAAWNRGTSTVAFAGTSTINTGTTNDFHNLTVTSGTTTVTNNTEVNNICTINGTLFVNTTKDLYAGGFGTIVVGDGGRLTGVGTGGVQIYAPGSGKGVTQFHSGGTWDIPRTWIREPNAAAELVAGNYQSAVRVFTASANNYTLTLDAAGAYQFDSLELETTSTGTLTLANNTNGPTSITVNGDLIFDRDDLDAGEGVITVNDSGVATNWVITGDVLNEGLVTWTKGTGTITAQASPYLKNGGGFSFNGVDDEVDINAQVHDFATDFTIAAWVRMPAVTSSGVNREIFTQGANCRFYINGAGRLILSTDNDTTFTDIDVFTANTWHHVMVMYDTSGTNEIVLYVDNATDPAWDEDKNAVNTAADSRIGSYLGTSYWFDGHIADVRVFDKALSTAERAALYNSGTGTTAVVAGDNDLGWYKLDESAADKTVVDTTGNNNGTSIQNTNVIRAPYNQAWDWSALTGEIEGVIVNKPFGTLTLTDDIDCTSWTQTDGTVDYNSTTVTTTGNLTLSAGADGLAAGLPGCTLAVGGHFSATGTRSVNLDMTAATSWTLTAGTAAARWVDVQNSDASGGNGVVARRCIDSGGNTNWLMTRQARRFYMRKHGRGR